MNLRLILIIFLIGILSVNCSRGDCPLELLEESQSEIQWEGIVKGNLSKLEKWSVDIGGEITELKQRKLSFSKEAGDVGRHNQIKTAICDCFRIARESPESSIITNEICEEAFIRYIDFVISGIKQDSTNGNTENIKESIQPTKKKASTTATSAPSLCIQPRPITLIVYRETSEAVAIEKAKITFKKGRKLKKDEYYSSTPRGKATIEFSEKDKTKTNYVVLTIEKEGYETRKEKIELCTDDVNEIHEIYLKPI